MTTCHGNCTFKGCKEPVNDHQYCDKHRSRMKRGLNPPETRDKVDGEDKVDYRGVQPLASSSCYQDTCSLNDIFPGLAKALVKDD